MAVGIAGYAAIALENGRRYAAARRESRAKQQVAAALEQPLAPPELPAVAGLEIAALLEPLGSPDGLAGDFDDLFPDVEAMPVTFLLRPGDTVVLHTDGLLERRGALLDEDAVVEILRGSGATKVEDILATTLGTIADLHPARDDVALLGLRCTAVAAGTGGTDQIVRRATARATVLPPHGAIRPDLLHTGGTRPRKGRRA